MTDRPNPFKDIEELFDRMSRGVEPRGLPIHDVAVDVSESDDHLTVTADLPGFDRADITVTVDDDQLTITGEHEESTDESTEESDEQVRYHRRERTHRTVSRSLRLPTAVDETAASAAYRNGVLTVTLPKQAPEADEGYDIDVQ